MFGLAKKRRLKNQPAQGEAGLRTLTEEEFESITGETQDSASGQNGENTDDERREFKRSCIGTRAMFRVAGSDSEPLSVLLRDLSPKGIGLLLDSPMEAGGQFWIYIPKRGNPDDRLAVCCEVERCERGGFEFSAYVIGADFVEGEPPPLPESAAQQLARTPAQPAIDIEQQSSSQARPKRASKLFADNGEETPTVREEPMPQLEAVRPTAAKPRSNLFSGGANSNEVPAVDSEMPHVAAPQPVQPQSDLPALQWKETPYPESTESDAAAKRSQSGGTRDDGSEDDSHTALDENSLEESRDSFSSDSSESSDADSSSELDSNSTSKRSARNHHRSKIQTDETSESGDDASRDLAPSDDHDHPRGTSPGSEEIDSDSASQPTPNRAQPGSGRAIRSSKRAPAARRSLDARQFAARQYADSEDQSDSFVEIEPGPVFVSEPIPVPDTTPPDPLLAPESILPGKIAAVSDAQPISDRAVIHDPLPVPEFAPDPDPLPIPSVRRGAEAKRASDTAIVGEVIPVPPPLSAPEPLLVPRIKTVVETKRAADSTPVLDPIPIPSLAPTASIKRAIVAEFTPDPIPVPPIANAKRAADSAPVPDPIPVPPLTPAASANRAAVAESMPDPIPVPPAANAKRVADSSPVLDPIPVPPLVVAPLANAANAKGPATDAIAPDPIPLPALPQKPGPMPVPRYSPKPAPAPAAVAPIPVASAPAQIAGTPAQIAAPATSAAITPATPTAQAPIPMPQPIAAPALVAAPPSDASASTIYYVPNAACGFSSARQPDAKPVIEELFVSDSMSVPDFSRVLEFPPVPLSDDSSLEIQPLPVPVVDANRQTVSAVGAAAAKPAIAAAPPIELKPAITAAPASAASRGPTSAPAVLFVADGLPVPDAKRVSERAPDAAPVFIADPIQVPQTKRAAIVEPSPVPEIKRIIERAASVDPMPVPPPRRAIEPAPAMEANSPDPASEPDPILEAPPIVQTTAVIDPLPIPKIARAAQRGIPAAPTPAAVSDPTSDPDPILEAPPIVQTRIVIDPMPVPKITRADQRAAAPAPVLTSAPVIVPPIPVAPPAPVAAPAITAIPTPLPESAFSHKTPSVATTQPVSPSTPVAKTAADSTRCAPVALSRHSSDPISARDPLAQEMNLSGLEISGPAAGQITRIAQIIGQHNASLKHLSHRLDEMNVPLGDPLHASLRKARLAIEQLSQQAQTSSRSFQDGMDKQEQKRKEEMLDLFKQFLNAVPPDNSRVA